jgi:hypothetical protein
VDFQGKNVIIIAMKTEYFYGAVFMKRSGLFSNVVFGAFACIIMSFFAGCGSPEPDIGLKMAQFRGAKLPVDARAEIILPMNKFDQKIGAGYGYEFRLLDDSSSLISAAKQMFGKVFKEVDVGDKIANPQFVIKVNADAKIYPSWSTYNVDVECQVEYGSGETIGTYKAKASQMTMVIEQAGLDKSYRKAMADIVIQMLDDPNAVEALAAGPDDTKAKKSIKIQEQASEYKKFVDGVVTIEMKKKVRWATSPISGHGSGFFIDSNGTILTNCHVVKDVKKADSAKVLCNDKEYDFDVIVMDEWSDLAMIKTKGISESPKLGILPDDEQGTRAYCLEGYYKLFQGLQRVFDDTDRCCYKSRKQRRSTRSHKDPESHRRYHYDGKRTGTWLCNSH